MLDAETLSFLDQLALALITANERVHYTLAQTPADLEAIYRLRYQTVIEEGWATPEAYPEGLEYDEYDARALHVVGWLDSALAVTMRLVFPHPDLLLPTEAGFNLRMEPYLQVVDLSRNIVAPAYRQYDKALFFGALGQCWQEIRQRGYHEFCGALTPWMIGYYERGGFDIQIVGELQDYWGAERYPVKFDLERMAARLRA